MIILVTGLPGAGKTLYTLQMVQAMVDAAPDRKVFFSGINDLRLPWTEIDADKWYECPSNSIVVIDECQRVFRPRMHGTAVPRFVSELETHRHLGIDVVLITQHPMLLDANARRLVGRHFHVVRKFGLQASTIHEWNSVKENCDKNRADSVRHEWVYPRSLFSAYKSAEVHTHKARLPVRLFLLGLMPFVVGGALWFGWHRYQAYKSSMVAVRSGASGTRPLYPASGPHVVESKFTPSSYAARFIGLPWTAPRYDDVTKPVRAPYPAACIANAHRCQCYTRSGTVLETTDAVCRSIVAHGFFKDWDEPEDKVADAASLPLPVDQQSRQVGQVGEPMASQASLRVSVEAAPASNPAPSPPPKTLLRGGTLSAMGSNMTEPSPPPSTSAADLALAAWAHGR